MRTTSLFQHFTILCLSVFLTASTVFAEATIGKPAPGFSLSSTTGKNFNLDDLKGKFVVLEWFNPDCPYVKKHYHTNNMQQLQKKFTDKGVVWLTLSSNAEGKQGHLNAQSGAKIISEYQLASSALLLDSDGTVGKKYGARTTPHMFIINPEGTLIYAGAIDDNDSTRESSVASAKNLVAAALDEALAGKPVTLASSEPYGCSVKYLM